MKEKVNPNHHMGKQTGYELIDGVYHIAPLYVEQFTKLAHQRLGIEEMVAMVTKHAADDLTQLSKLNQQIWEELYEDLGLDKSKPWKYKGDGTIEEKQ